jgi:hypothetical protein
MTAATVFAASFAALYAGHMIADHVLQTDWQAANKTGKSWTAAEAMLGHLATYWVCQAVALVALHAVGIHASGWNGFAGLAFSAATHGLIDRRTPVRWLLEHTGSRDFAALASRGLNGMYLADQALQVGCLFVAALLIAGLS